ncbi:MAG TPA: hypothetical protein VFA45_18370 [Actinomycetes bacterium]|jgi:hypothetical protein|nr:hypothetical protein [Actinomycetes bacterium]
MRASRPSPFDALETSFQLLTTGPEPLAIDGRRLGHGLPARPISVRELAAVLVHPSVPAALQRRVLDELVQRATHDRGVWIVRLAGVLLPGLRRAAALTRPVNTRVACEVEADLLQRYQAALSGPPPAAAHLAVSVLETARAASGSPSRFNP